MITVLQIPPKVEVGQYWRGFEARPNFNRRKVQVLEVENGWVQIGFCDNMQDDKFLETCTFPESMFSNILTGYVYFSADNK